MLMYKAFLRKIEKMDICDKGTNDNGYYIPAFQEIGSKKDVNMQFSSSSKSHSNPMKVLFLFPEICYQMKNIESICDSLNVIYQTRWSVDGAIGAVRDNVFDVVVVDRRQYDYDKLDVDNIVYRMRKELSDHSSKIISFSGRRSEDYSKLWDQGYDEQWIQYDDFYSLKNYLASYLRNQYCTAAQLKKASMLQNVFDKLTESVEILNSDFQIETANLSFQKLFNQNPSDIAGTNWFTFHKITPDKIDPIMNEVSTKKNWTGLLSNNSNEFTDNINYLLAEIKCLNTTTSQYIVRTSNVSSDESKLVHSIPIMSTERESNSVISNKKKEPFLGQSQISIESPILKIMQIIKSIQDLVSPVINYQLQKIVEILSSKDLFITTVDALKTDKMSSNLIDGLLSNNATIFAQTETRRHSSSLARRRQTRDNSEIIHDHINQVLAKINKIPEIPENEEIGEIDELLKDHQNWSFDILRLEVLSEYKPLGYLGMKIFHHTNLGATLNIDAKLFQNWLCIIESNYNESNTYHNSTHAADVLQSSAWFLERRSINEIFDSYDDAISIIAAIVHDLGHPGRTNPFLINSNNNLAVLYNDIAVLENHHVSFAFKLTLKDDRINIFKNLSSDDYRSMRHGIIDAVLATEMAKHFEHLTKFVNNILNDNNFNGNASSLNLENIVENAHYQSMDVLSQPENKAIIRRMLIKCSDVNNPTRPFTLSREWAYRISQEYFNQTDDEIAMNIPVVMPQFNRATCNIPQSQITFIEIFLEDMFRLWDTFADTKELIANLHENKVRWKAITNEENGQSILNGE